MTYLPAQALTRELVNMSQLNIEVLDFRSLPYFKCVKLTLFLASSLNWLLTSPQERCADVLYSQPINLSLYLFCQNRLVCRLYVSVKHL